ncbi:MAG: hypothetical protein GHCLOJNM_04458 [bacterium]|nr:hypothetical protein [bacterium]
MKAFTLALLLCASAVAQPEIVKMGTIDCDLVETTPVVFKGHLYRFEWVRANYSGNEIGNHFRLVDVERQTATPPFAKGYMFGSAFVENDTAYVTGTLKSDSGDRIDLFVSRDLEHWETRSVHGGPEWGIFNTSLCKADGKYVLMFEIDKPADQAGAAFTARFLESSDLVRWNLTPPECNYAKDRYTAPHCLRWLDGWYFDFYLEAGPGFYEMRVVRSKDLIHWESSPLNPVLHHSEEDRKAANPKLSADQRERIAQAVNLNNSDIDFCEHNGRLVIYYSWGNQQGIEHLAEAYYQGTEQDFLKGWFPNP